MPAPKDRFRTADEYAVERLIFELYMLENPHVSLKCSRCPPVYIEGRKRQTNLMVYNDGTLVCYNCEQQLDNGYVL